jgi:chaperone required for assembly of F1-ATPase
VTRTTKSLVIGLAVVSGKVDAALAADAALVEAAYQSRLWGYTQEGYGLERAFIDYQLAAATCFLQRQYAVISSSL